MLRRLWIVLLALAMLGAIGAPGALAASPVNYLDPTDPDNLVKSRTDYTLLNQTWFVNSPYQLGTSGTTTWYLVRGDITLNGTLTIDGDVNLILENGCALTVNASNGSENSGINVGDGHKLTIYAQSAEAGVAGRIVATGDGISASSVGGAGIGSKTGQQSSTITISGGNITATGGKACAGIGGGGQKAGGAITINGGSITANGGDGGAGIGGGALGSAGTIVITGGRIEATGSGWAAGIGNGANAITGGGTIEISGGSVNATGGAASAGIGGNTVMAGPEIRILGSTARITALGGDAQQINLGGGAGIGSGGSSGGVIPANIYIEDMSTIMPETQGGAAGTGGGENNGGAGAAIGSGGGNGVAGQPIVRITKVSGDQTLPVGGTATFSVTVDLTTGATYAWEKLDGTWKPINRATNPLTLTDLTHADAGQYRCKVTGANGAVISAPMRLQVYTPTTYSTPTVTGDNALTAVPGTVGARTFAATLSGADFGAPIPFTCTAGGQTASCTASENGPLSFSFSAAQLDALAAGAHDILVTSEASGYNRAVTGAKIGALTLIHAPTVSGTNDLSILPGSTFQLPFAARLTGSDPSGSVPLTLSVGGRTATVQQHGDGTALFPLALDQAASGTIPVTVSAPATANASAIPETTVGQVTVLDAAKYLRGDLVGKLNTDWLFSWATGDVPIALRAAGAMTDEASGILSTDNKQALSIRINDAAPGEMVATLQQARLNPFSGKSAQPVPNLPRLSVEGKVTKSKKIAAIEFSAQEMARLLPGLYTFEIQALPSGKFKGFGPLALATLRVTDANAVPTEWTIPKALRVSVGQQYQLVKPIPFGGDLPELTVKTGNKKIATIDKLGVLTAKKSGSTTITVRGQDGGNMKCKLTVVANSYSRSTPLYIKGQPGLYTSTKRLYYEKGALKAEVFVANNTGATIRGADGLVFELYDGDALVYARSAGLLTFTLKHKKYGVYKLTITNDMFQGVSTKAFDLGSKRYRAVLRGENAIPLIGSTKGALPTKPTTFQSISTTIKPIQPTP